MAKYDLAIVHVSDIHFPERYKGTELDPNRHLRTRLSQDAKAVTRDFHCPMLIVATGDIAYAGKRAEYKQATAWLDGLASTLGIPRSHVRTVPGNHDVNRELFKQNTGYGDIRDIIRNADRQKRHEVLLQRLQDEKARDYLALPLENYNEFASQYGCSVLAPERLGWQTKLDLDHKWSLVVYGLNSALISGPTDKQPNLYLSPFQTNFAPEDRSLNLIACHHPPDWLLDGENVLDHLQNNACVHLFGHKHRQRVIREARFVSSAAGAVHPDLTEADWQPGYNIIGLKVSLEEDRFYLDCEVHQRDWKQATSTFSGVNDPVSNQPFFSHRITLPVTEVPAEVNTGTEARESSTHSTETTTDDAPTTIYFAEADTSDMSESDLYLRFFRLASSAKRKIVADLELAEAGDEKLPFSEQMRLAATRPAERDIIGAFAQAIAKAEMGDQ